MTISDFRIFQAAVESRYDDAYLLFDRTGAICRELRIKWPDSKLQEASPAKTICRNGPEAFSLELRQAAHVLSAKPVSDLQQFTENAEWFFSLLQDQLKISTYTRLGFRVVFKREVKSHADASDLFKRTKLLRIPTQKVFGTELNTTDLTYSVRFQSDTLGALVRIATETLHMEFEPPQGSEDFLKPVKQETHFLVYDVDYYTLALVDVAQLRLREWLKQAMHAIRRDSAEFIEVL
jgi:hypothetical protein